MQQLSSLVAAFFDRTPFSRVNAFVRNLMVMVGGTVTGQLVTVLVAPVLTRVYEPSDFGALGLYSSAISILLVICSMRYESAIPLAAEDLEARSLATLSLLILAGFALLILIAIWVLHGIPGAIGVAFPWWQQLIFVPLGIIGAGIYQILYYCAVRAKQFSAIARTRIIQSGGMAVVQTGIGVFFGGAIGLISGDLVGRTLGVRSLMRGLHLFDGPRPGWAGLRKASIAYRDFPRLMLAAALFNVLSIQLPLLVLPQLFGLDGAGQFFLSYRILTLPISVLSMAASQALYAEVASSPGETNMAKVTKESVMLICGIALPAYAGFSVIGSEAFTVIFGQAWSRAGLFAQIMCPMVFLRLVGSSLSTLLIVGRRFAEALWFTVAELITVVVALAWGSIAGSTTLFVVAFTLLSLPLGVASIWRFARVGNVTLKQLFTLTFLPVFLVSLPAALASVLAMVFLKGWPVLIIWLVVSASAAGFSLKLARVRLLVAREIVADRI